MNRNVQKKGTLDAIDHAIHWLEHSDIRIQDIHSPFYGAYFNAYHPRTKSDPWVYCEISGYAVQFWLRLFQWKEDHRFLSLAESAGDFLLKVQSRDDQAGGKGAFPYGFNASSHQKVKRYFTFDNAIGLASLIDLYRVNKNHHYLLAAIETGKWLISMQGKDGSFHALFSEEGDDPQLPRIEAWFGGPGSLHGKNAIGLLKLFQESGDPTYRESAVRILDWVLKLQNPDGSIRSYDQARYTFTHAHSYALEGYLFAYLLLGIDRYREALLKGSAWLLKMQNRDGSINKCAGPDIKIYIRQTGYRFKIFTQYFFPRDTGPLAQAIRIWLVHYGLTGEREVLEGIKKATASLLSMQTADLSDQNGWGGFYSSVQKIWIVDRRSPWIYPWETMFACHALRLLQEEKMNLNNYMDEIF